MFVKLNNNKFEKKNKQNSYREKETRGPGACTPFFPFVRWVSRVMSKIVNVQNDMSWSCMSQKNMKHSKTL